MKAFRDYLTTTILLLGFLSVYFVIHYDIPYPNEVGPQFDKRIRPLYTDILNEDQPEIFLLGDSMLGTAVNENIVREQLDRKVHMASLPGTASTIWYSILKNNIVVADHPPQYIVMFFRDSMMSAPGYRVTGTYFQMVDEFASPEDTLIIERAYINQMSRLERLMEAYFPLYGARWNVRESIDRQIRYTLGNHVLGCDESCMDDSMELVFKQDNLDETFLIEAIDDVDEYLYTESVLDFKEQNGKSFLPEIIRLCRENDIQLILVRMPILRFENIDISPMALTAYIQDLRVYLEENDVPFLDFDQKDIKTEYFADAIHLNEQGKVLFTQKLVGALRSIVK